MNKRTPHIPELFFIVSVFLGAIVFRLWFISLAPQPFVYDQEEYERFASRIYDSPYLMGAHSYRTYPYPFFIAMVYKFTGFANHQAIYAAQAVIDSIIVVMIYWLLKQSLNHGLFPAIGAILYGFNPFTTGYVGVVLSEILTAFFMVATIVAGVVFVKRKSVGRGIALGLCAGLAAETRNAAFVWAAIPIFLTINWRDLRTRLAPYIGVIAGLFLSIVYPLVNNWITYKEINITTVDSFYAKEFFNGVVLKRLEPFTMSYPAETGAMFYEYYSEYYPQRTSADRKAMATKYYQNAWERIVADPIDYIKVRFFKMWYMWQKENVFFYTEPGYKDHRVITYVGNLLLVLLSLIGCIFGRTLTGSKTGVYIYRCFVGSLLYATLAFSLSHAEYRITIPFYPIVIALSAIGLMRIIGMARGKM